MNKQDVFKLVASIFICYLTGLVGFVFARPAIKNWYIYLDKPGFTPPNWLFAPAWLIFYALMGIALYLIWKKGLSNRPVKKVFWLFIVHLFFNASWLVVFFGFTSLLGGVFNIIFLWAIVIILIYRSLEIDKRVAYILFPYWLGVSFAGILNITIWLFNSLWLFDGI